ncbi:MAG: S9 family peptidase [Cognatishimia sp.]|uniref:alpha/beta hydrolase family protein n=1 Tax=Cognatishimia sp. TaxID=2211648 RepID=UPI003B8C58EF
MKRVFKWVAGILLGATLFGVVGLAWVTRDYEATHEVLRNSDLPSIIPVREFYADQRAQWSYRASFDGEYLAWRGTRLTEEVVFFGRVGEKPLGWAKDIHGFYWNDVSAHLMLVSNGRLWKVDPEASDKDNWSDVTPRGFGHWTWPNHLHQSQERWLVSSSDRNPAFSDLYTTRQDGSDKQLLVENDGRTLNWILSKDLEPLLRIRRAKDLLDRTVERWDGIEWQTVLDLSVNTNFWIVEALEDNETVIAISSRGRDKAALVEVDLLTGTEEVIHAEADEDVFDVVNFDPFDGLVDAVLPKRGSSDVIPLSKKGEVLAKLIAQYGQRVEVEHLSWSGVGDSVMASLSPDAMNYVFVLMDLVNGTSELVQEQAFRRRNLDRLSTSEEVEIQARDGLMLNAILVRPKGVQSAVPTVIEVHGGPAGHVEWQYDHFRQFLANRGYAILSVNFRGSTGAGLEFQSKGFRQFGRKMQDDLVDAANWAVSQGIAAPDALAVMGASYGGYASAMSVMTDESPFKAAIIEHAMLDVKYQSQYPPHSWGLNISQWRRYFGDASLEADAAVMDRYSPNKLVEKLKVPVLLVAGKRDSVVGFEQTESFMRQAEAFGKDAELLLFEKAGHGLNRWQSKVQHARKVEDFLHQHLGGRSGGWDWIEIAADHLD